MEVGDIDNDGISIDENFLSEGIVDLAGNPAAANQVSMPDNPDFKVFAPGGL